MGPPLRPLYLPPAPPDPNCLLRVRARSEQDALHSLKLAHGARDRVLDSMADEQYRMRAPRQPMAQWRQLLGRGKMQADAKWHFKQKHAAEGLRALQHNVRMRKHRRWQREMMLSRRRLVISRRAWRTWARAMHWQLHR